MGFPFLPAIRADFMAHNETHPSLMKEAMYQSTPPKPKAPVREDFGNGIFIIWKI